MHRLLVPVVLLAVLAAGAAPASPPAREPDTLRTTIYFLTEDGVAPLGVRRTVLRRPPPPWGSFAAGALDALLAGPSPEEAAHGLTTAIPAGTRLLGFELRGYGGTGAVVNLSGLEGIGDGLDRARVITQVVRTLVGVSGIGRVWFRSDGRPWGMWLMKGGVHDGPYDYGDLAGFWLSAGCPGTETLVCDRFKALP
jgi:spore germination protein GerM